MLSTFTGELNNYIENVRKSHDQIINTVNIDKVEFADWDAKVKDNAKETVEDF